MAKKMKKAKTVKSKAAKKSVAVKDLQAKGGAKNRPVALGIRRPG